MPDDMRGHNRSLSERFADALLKAGDAKAEALRAKKRAERTYDIAFLGAEGKNADERKAKARVNHAFKEADDLATEAECAAIVAKSEADALEVMFEAWRTGEATRRSEMTLR